MAHTDPAILSNTATQEIEAILGKELNILFAIDIQGNIRRVYSSHLDITAITALKDNNNDYIVNKTTSLLIKTRIPKLEIEEEIDLDPLHLIHCPCCHSARCRTCD